jgi:hypothetical protein
VVYYCSAVYSGFLPSNDALGNFNWFGPSFSGSRFLTPLLFELTSPGVFTVVGFGNGQTVTYNGSPQSFAFGNFTTTDTGFTFGFVSGLVSSNGSLSSTSAGSVGLNFTVDGPPAVGGFPTSNDWLFTPSIANITVAVGTTFQTPGVSGSNPGSTNFPLNDNGLGGFSSDRTYSANVNGSISGVPEPGTFSLITGGGLVLAGLFRYRYLRD